MLEKAAHEGVARIFFVALDARGSFRPRQQHLRLDVNQRRGHDEELAGDVQIQLLHQRDRVEILRRDQRDRDVVDVHLVGANEVEQQIERPLEVREPDGERLGRRLEVCVKAGHRYAIFIASRTRAIVVAAIVRARFDPSKRISFRRSGRASTCARRSRIGARYAFIAFASFVFTSTSPTLPAR